MYDDDDSNVVYVDEMFVLNRAMNHRRMENLSS